MSATNAAKSGAMPGTVATSRDERADSQTQKITTFLWFDNNAEEAVNFYISVFKNSRVIGSARYGETGPGPKGTIMTIDFELDGVRYNALNGGPNFKFTEAMSLVVHCQTQEEVDYYWEKLSEGGQTIECGWLKDKFGLFWQITPNLLIEQLQSDDEQKVDRVMKAMMQMKKLDIEGIRKAAEER